MRRGLTSLIAAGLLGAAAATAGSSAVYALTLEEAVGLAVQTNPRVGVVSNDRLAVGRELRQGRALYLPQVDLRAAAGPEFSDNQNTEDRGEDGGDVLIRKEASLTLSQLLFDGFYADSEVERQEARQKSAGLRVAETAQFVALDAVEAYLEVLRHRERMEIATQNVETHRSMLDTVRKRATGGGGSIGDVRQAETRLASAQSALIVTQGDLHDAEALFQRVIGEAPDTLSKPALPADVPASVDDALAACDVNSPTIAISKADMETAEALVKQQESSLYPDFRLELLGSVRDDADGEDRTDYTASALVVMRWNLYRGGADDARIREFKYRLEEARSQIQATTRDAEEEVRRSWNAVQVAHGNVGVLTSELQAAEQTRGVYRQQWDLGQRSLLDLLDSNNDVYRSHDNLITAEYAELFANYRLLASSGLLVKDLGVALPATAAEPSATASNETTPAGQAPAAPAEQPMTPEPAQPLSAPIEPVTPAQPTGTTGTTTTP